MSKLTVETAGELIGSRRWGGWYENSDYDIIIKEADYLEVIAYLNVVPERDHHYATRGELLNSFHSYYADKDSGKMYNFLVYKSDTFFEIAKEASRQLDTICRTSLGIIMRNDKNIRYRVVENTFKAVKILFDSSANKRLSSLYGEDSAFGVVPAPTDYPIRMEERTRRNRNPFSADTGDIEAFTATAATPVYAQVIRTNAVEDPVVARTDGYVPLI